MPRPKKEAEPVRFKKGDRVQWASTGRGGTTKKVGDIVAVVKAGKYPSEALLKRDSELRVMFDQNAMPRNHESYIVKVIPGKAGTPVLYWPRVHHLDKVVVPE